MRRSVSIGVRGKVAMVSAVWLLGLVAAGGDGVAASPDAGAAGGVTSRASVGPGGVQANKNSLNPAVSSNGRYVVFVSAASNLVAGDTNEWRDVFLRDRKTHVTQQISVARGGAQGNGNSFVAAISADGRYVAFDSLASNLVAGDTNGSTDVFVRDRVAQVTRRVSVGPGGSQGDFMSHGPAISAHGRFVAFTSDAENLVAGDTNLREDVFVRDLAEHVTRRVSVGPRGAQGDRESGYPAISAHGRYVAYDSSATNLVAGDTNLRQDVFVRDRSAGVTRRVSVGPRGAQANRESYTESISADGRYVAFHSRASNLVAGHTKLRHDVFIRDRVAQVTRLVSVGPRGAQANGDSYTAVISADGRYVAFKSKASNLVATDTNNRADVFVRDRVAKVTRRVSVGPRGAQAVNGGTFTLAISEHGRYVVFDSSATNLVARDTNDAWEVFVRDRSG